MDTANISHPYTSVWNTLPKPEEPLYEKENHSDTKRFFDGRKVSKRNESRMKTQLNIFMKKKIKNVFCQRQYLTCLLIFCANLHETFRSLHRPSNACDSSTTFWKVSLVLYTLGSRLNPVNNITTSRPW